MNMNENLLITIYLNQKIVFDMLATLEDGFSQLSEISKTEKNVDDKESNVGGKVGVSNVFTFLGINFNAGRKAKTSESDESTRTESKVHTPSSLFVKLLSELTELNKINEVKSFSDLNELNTGDFVKFKGVLIKNPLISTIESFSKIMELVYAFNDPAQGHNRKKQSGGQSNNEYLKIKQQMEFFTKALKDGNTFDIICKIDDNLTSVINVYENYFFNNNINEIVDGEYTVVGKVVKISKKDNGDTINLLRNTGLNLAKKELMDNMLEGFQSGDISSAGIEVPSLSTIIEDNAMLIIPICIYT